jgi:hypothetical protein
MSNDNHAPDTLLGDDSQDPADTFLLRDGEVEEDTNDDSYREDQFNSDAEADGDALASAGLGTDEDYGCYGGGDE